MKFVWKDDPEIGSYELLLLDNDGKEMERIWLKDNTAPWCVEDDTKHRYQRLYAFEVNYCKGFSMSQGFDKDEDGYYNGTGGYHGPITHTVEEIKRWCENYIAQMYLRDYQRALATLDEKRQRSEWFKAQGFKLESEAQAT